MKKFQVLIMFLWLSVSLAGAVESRIQLVHGPYLQNLGPDEVNCMDVGSAFCRLGGVSAG